MGFSDEVDAASGARGDWGRDPDGDNGDAGAVSYCNRGQCKAIQLLLCTDEERGMGALRPRLYVKGVQKFALSPKALRRMSLEHLLEDAMATRGTPKAKRDAIMKKRLSYVSSYKGRGQRAD